MDTPRLKNGEQRGDYIENWYQIEKSAERIGSVLLFFAAALIVVFDKPGDQYTLYALVGCIAGSATLLLMSRKARAARTALNFLREKPQTTRAIFAGMGAMILMTQFASRPLALIVSALLLAVAAWFQWRAYKIKRYDELFKPAEAALESEGDKPA